MKKLLVIEGMSCGHCVQAVTKALKAMEGVTEAVVDLEKKQATVELSGDGVTDAMLRDEIEEAGYSVTEIVTL